MGRIPSINMIAVLACTCISQYSMLHHCVEPASARCIDCSQPNSIDLERLAAKESIVIGLDEDTIGQLPLDNRKWVEQVYNFLERYIVLYEYSRMALL